MANRSRRVIQCELNGNEIRVFASAKEAAKAFNTQWATSIHRSIQYGRPAFGYRWKYEGEELKNPPSGTPGKRRRIVSISIQTNESLIHPSISQAARDLGIGVTSIENALQTGSKAKGYCFRYEGEEMITPARQHPFKRPIIALDKEGNIVHEWPSVYDAAKELGVTIGAIYQCLGKDSQNRKCRGYRWEYKDS